MNYKITALAFSTTLLLSGCASMGQQGRIGKNDGSDPCFIYLENIDSTAMFYKDERLKQLLTGAAIGTASGAALGVGTAALAKGDLVLGAIIGGIAGGVAGAFVANAYWDNRLKQANQQSTLAAGYVENDLKEDVEKINAIDTNISGLVRCRTQRRDEIRKQFADRKLTQEQAQLEWQKWGELIKKDREEMKYMGEALDNIKKIEESYNYAATMIETPVATVNPIVEEPTTVDNEPKPKNNKKLKGKHPKRLKNVHNKSEAIPKKPSASNVASPKPGKLKTMVSSMHEKYESIKKNKNEFDKLALQASNSKGFEQIESRLNPIYRQALSPIFMSKAMNSSSVPVNQTTELTISLM